MTNENVAAWVELVYELLGKLLLGFTRKIRQYIAYEDEVECSKLFPGTDEVMLLETQAVLNGILDDPVHACPVKMSNQQPRQAALGFFQLVELALDGSVDRALR